MSPRKVETKDTYLIVHFEDGVKHIDMKKYLKDWQSADAQKLLQNLSGDLSKVYLEDGYAISWPNYKLSIDPETFYKDADSGYPMDISASLVKTLKKLV